MKDVTSGKQIQNTFFSNFLKLCNLTNTSLQLMCRVKINAAWSMKLLYSMCLRQCEHVSTSILFFLLACILSLSLHTDAQHRAAQEVFVCHCVFLNAKVSACLRACMSVFVLVRDNGTASGLVCCVRIIKVVSLIIKSWLSWWEPKEGDRGSEWGIIVNAAGVHALSLFSIVYRGWDVSWAQVFSAPFARPLSSPRHSHSHTHTPLLVHMHT